MPERARAEAGGGEVRSVARALDLLEALARGREVGLVELAAAAGLVPSTAHRLLGTLVRRGYVHRSPESGRYLLGFGVLELAGDLTEHPGRLQARVAPYMARVRKVCRETTNLVVLHGRDVVYVDQLAGRMPARTFAEVGQRVPAHTTGAGKAILAHRTPEWVQQLYQGARLEPFTARTITSVAELQAELALTRRRGYARDDREREERVSCVAAPVFDERGGVRCALSVSAPSARIDETGPDALGELVGTAALDASRELGWDGTSVWAGESSSSAREHRVIRH